MPRIKAANIAEHVRQQEAAILGAAAELFAERGVAAVDLGDIAEAVGLARSSLYRYFPDKDHILLRWFERELEPVVAASAAIAADDAPPAQRLARWIDFQLDYVADPAHQVAPRLSREVGALDPTVARQIGEGHARLYATLGRVVAERLAEQRPGRGHARRDPVLVTKLVGGIVQAGAQAVIDGGDPKAVRAEVQRAASALLG